MQRHYYIRDSNEYEKPTFLDWLPIMGIRILFIVPHPLKKSPSQRFRFEQYFHSLEQSGFDYSLSPFLNSHNWLLFSKSGHFLNKLLALAIGFSKRSFDLIRSPFYHFIFIHREACPIGPPVFEWIVKFILRKKIIFDFDDAIWLTDKKNESTIERTLKWRSKVKNICKWSHRISCSNQYLKAYAAAFHDNVICLPTTVDTELIHNPDIRQASAKIPGITIGWTGSHSTLKYLALVEEVISGILLAHSAVNFLVICDRKPTLSIPGFQFLAWNLETEAEDLLNIDIGVMPLPDDDWTRGKAGFKCIQYMALRIPVVASNVGENIRLVEPNINGFLANDASQWRQALEKLIADKHLRESLGMNGRRKVQQRYSVAANTSVFLSLFK